MNRHHSFSSTEEIYPSCLTILVPLMLSVSCAFYIIPLVFLPGHQRKLSQCKSLQWLNLLLNCLIRNLLKYLWLHFIYKLFVYWSSPWWELMPLDTQSFASFCTFSGSQTSAQSCLIRSASLLYLSFVIVHIGLSSTLSITMVIYCEKYTLCVEYYKNGTNMHILFQNFIMYVSMYVFMLYAWW